MYVPHAKGMAVSIDEGTEDRTMMSRSITFGIRLTPAERKTIEHAAKLAERSPSDWARRTLLLACAMRENEAETAKERRKSKA